MDNSRSKSEPDPRYKWKVLVSVLFGLFMVILDTTVLNVALPAIQTRFQVGTSQVQWVISLYVLVLGVATPLAGFLADRYGSKRVYLAALCTFVCGSVLCGFAPSLTLLIAARAVQGVGGGIALPVGSAMLFGAFPPQERARAFGYFGFVIIFAPAVGPLLSGWLVDSGHLSWIFFINVPIGVLGVATGALLLRRMGGSGSTRLDVRGVVLSIAGFGAVLFAVSVAGDGGAGWGDPIVLVPFVGGLIALCLLAVIEWRGADPLLDVRLFSNRVFAAATVTAMAGVVALFGAEFLLPIYLQILRGASAFRAGTLLLPLAATAMVTTPLAGRLADRIGPRVPLVVGFLVLSVNTFELAHLTMTTSFPYIAVLFAIRGLALGLVIQNTQVAALAEVARQRLNRATALLNSLRQTSQSIGVAVLATVVSMTLTIPGTATQSLSDLSPHAPHYLLIRTEYLTGITRAYWVTFSMSLVAAALALMLPGWPGALQQHKS